MRDVLLQPLTACALVRGEGIASGVNVPAPPSPPMLHQNKRYSRVPAQFVPRLTLYFSFVDSIEDDANAATGPLTGAFQN